MHFNSPSDGIGDTATVESVKVCQFSVNSCSISGQVDVRPGWCQARLMSGQVGACKVFLYGWCNLSKINGVKLIYNIFL